MNKKIILVVVGIIVLFGTFYGGMVYGKSQKSNTTAGVQNFALGARGMRNGGNFGGGAGGESTVGQIISKDNTSITLSTMNGGSKIVFLNNNTPISKQTSGTMTDLTVGTEVFVTGASDAASGSITAQSIQIRPKIAQPVVK